MKAKVQGRFPFLGKMRVPGDILSDEELGQVTPTVRDALVGQKLIVLDGSDDQASTVAELMQGLADLRTRVDALERKLASRNKAA